MSARLGDWKGEVGRAWCRPECKHLNSFIISFFTWHSMLRVIACSCLLVVGDNVLPLCVTFVGKRSLMDHWSGFNETLRK